MSVANRARHRRDIFSRQIVGRVEHPDNTTVDALLMEAGFDVATHRVHGAVERKRAYTTGCADLRAGVAHWKTISIGVRLFP
ncbi:hypothetical protein B5V01_11015 [Mesorhizobium erdmanii]|uniref:Uncharacterized protein n=1 Tax=Mesorhizobium erdmanii TaxID=1777866 RepID=A0A4Q1V8Z2_9HYPH|nr:hypothetical protein B5V01_11015 [Mesorhizobium erdmanii]